MPESYADLLRITTPALRAADPAAKLILAGLIPFKTIGAGSVPGGKYLQRLYKVKGVRKLFDAVAIHPYGNSPPVVLKAMKEIRKLLNELGARKAPLWATEFGWTTGGVGFASSPFRSSLPQQASRLSKSYRLLRKNRKRLKLKSAIWFSHKDSDAPGADEWPFRMGLFDLAGQPKPSWSAYAQQAGGQP